MKIIFASQNPNKLNEIQSQLANYTVVGLDPLLFPEELQETGTTLYANARQKAQQVWDKTQESCFADDTGLEVDALNDAPGVYSARYAGAQKNAEDNMNLLLLNLSNKINRKARFRTCISLCLDGVFYEFEGVCEGEITLQKLGEKGFGYDPIFLPNDSNRTFAEMSLVEKARVSHRGIAIAELVNFLKNRSFVA
ncbi:MAG: RdgB/HAM1 family non-canonical purine NTP pyrophosphatase [Bacteroidia bacterium]|nr:RdgB/HAM1 family non-canonical purine NTP pyrophosphatase [Bacteroidia bacterium]|tara:strand:+ start:5632 stop:6216 length:585 start_codon:yes stop_codon:yes gene_type:complete